MNGNPNKTILLVDDESIIALSTAGQLKTHGFDVITAFSGEEAVDVALSGKRIDLVLMDIDLGKGMDGTEAAAVIIREKGLPVLFLSNHTELEVVEKTEGFTSYGYVVKNSGETVLLASIRMAFRLHAANRTLLGKNEEIETSNEELQAALEELESSNEELLRSQDDLQQSEAYQRQIIHNAPFGAHFYRLGNDGALVFTGANSAADRILGIDHRTFIGTTIEQAFPGLVDTPIPSIYREIAAKGITYQQDQVQYNEGRISGAYEINAFQTAPGLMAVFFTDITERRKDREELIRKNEELERFFNASLDLLCIADTDGNFRRLNPEWEKTLGYGLSELVGKKFLDFVHPDDVQTTLDAMTRLSQQKEVLDFINRYRAKDGAYRWIEWRSYPVGNLIYAAARDITERRRAENDLRESEEKFRFLAEKMGDVVWTLDLQLRTTYISPSTLRILGFTPEERKQQTLDEVMTPESLARVMDVLARELEREKEADVDPDRVITLEVEYYHKNGTTVWLENSMKALRDARGTMTGVYGVSRDISERKRAETAQRESEERFAAFMNYLPGMVLIKDSELRLVYANRRYRELFPADAWMGKTPWETFPPEIADRMAENDRKALKEGYVRYEEQWKGLDGTEYYLETNKFRIDRGEREPFLGAILMDITERTRTEASLAAALDEKNALFRELQHRVKNSLAMITSLVGLESEQARDSVTKEALENLRGRINTLSNLYTMLFAGGETKDIRLDRYIHVIAQSLMGAYLQGEKRVELRLSLADISIDAKKASSYGLILNELVTNAFKYAFPGDSRGVIEVILKREGSETLLEVTDDGVGLPADFKMAESRGLGLVLVRMLARQLGGEAASSSAGATRFTIRVPSE